jgi:hypothetical protein
MTSLGLSAQPISREGHANDKLVGDTTLRRYFNPSRETLWAKIAGLEQTLRVLSGAGPDTSTEKSGCCQRFNSAPGTDPRRDTLRSCVAECATP